ncbi:DUF6457 domain-containing protein [Corynebacterium gerontici]|uniref:DUF6457 domain-containing protein n=1 Tax=Corynebacterium gerontici TaxID=2079234 RepID=A0A3G6J1Y6_9CORY|nr:DUF6457 domain-containing protein [Corynebacterium gerontici]AZA12071.1 hypothetical protein CGERO_08900 [Corynebacterium gerontici]
MAQDLSSTYEWVEKAAAALSIDKDLAREMVPELLELTREVAHNQARPAAPLTAFLVGLAFESDTGASASEQAAHLRRLIAQVRALLEA